MVYQCQFCEIAAGQSPADIVYEDEEVVVFRNRLGWVPVMLLVVPRKHMTQQELWSDLGHAGDVAVRMGQQFCPNGFRLLSNFGGDALQTQPHGHIHVLGGAWLGEYA
jgi:histidine triad (HIT) family protein